MSAAEAVLKNKSLFQGHQLPATMGVSPTNRDSYRLSLHGIGIVIASNTWADDLRKLNHEDATWLEQNAVVVPVLTPLYEK